MSCIHWSHMIASFLLVSAILTAGSASQAAPLFPNPVYEVGSNPYGLGMADFNRDGVQDLVVANFGAGYDGLSGDVSVLIGHGDGTFSSEMRIPTSQHASDALAADVDGDGV